MNGQELRVLVVGRDAERTGRLAGPLVRESGAFPLSVEFLADRRAALDRLPAVDADCVACDAAPGSASPDEFLASLREAAPAVPVVLFADDGARLEAVDGEVADAVRVGPDGEGVRDLLASVEAAAAVDGRRAVRSGAWYEALLASTSDVVMVLDATGTAEYVSPSIRHVLGYDPDAVVGTSVFEYVRPADREAVRDQFHEHVDGGTGPSVAVFELERADGGTCVLEARGHNHLETDPIEGYVVSVRDVAERERREGDLAEYEMVVETAPVGLTTIDAEGTIAWANEVYAETLDVPREELVGTPFSDLVEAGYYDGEIVDDYLENVRRLLSSSSDADRANYLVRTHLPDGETLFHDVHVALLPMEDGEFVGTVSAFRDVTKQERYKRELERQNERLDAFASVVSHDLRNPLSVAQTYLDLATETEDLDALETVASAHERMEALVEDLLSLARLGRTVEDPTPTAVAAVARRAWEAVETGDDALEVTDVGEALADPARLQQVLENLFRNSVEHGSTGSRAEPDDSVEHGSTSDRPEADDGSGDGGAGLTVTVGPLDDGTGFFVADDGTGIPAGERERVFERGYTTDPAGTGFGLTIVGTIAAAHGWSVDAVEGDGARFEVTGVEYAARDGER